MNFFRKIFYLSWYFRDPPWDTNQSPPELLKFIQSNPPGRALDLGCGTGTNVITLAKNGWQATGVDFIPRAIRSARRKAKIAGIQADFKVGDVTRLEGITGPYDLILDIGCYHGINTHRMAAYRENIQRLLAPGGVFLLYLFFRPEETQAHSGAVEADLEPFISFLDLIQRQDGTERGIRRAAWLTYKNSLIRS